MMTRFRLSLFALLIATPVATHAAEAVHGLWLRSGHADKLEFFDCEGKLCAHGVIPTADGSPQPLILRHAAKVGENQWKGDLFNPEDGKLYSGTITLDNPNQLTLKGCLVAFLCQSETWTRVGSKPASPAKPTSAKPAPGKASPPKPAAKPAGKPGAAEPEAQMPEQ
jgi:uncharacterized protein (DUF2147 family)